MKKEGVNYTPPIGEHLWVWTSFLGPIGWGNFCLLFRQKFRRPAPINNVPFMRNNKSILKYLVIYTNISIQTRSRLSCAEECNKVHCRGYSFIKVGNEVGIDSDCHLQLTDSVTVVNQDEAQYYTYTEVLWYEIPYDVLSLALGNVVHSRSGNGAYVKPPRFP